MAPGSSLRELINPRDGPEGGFRSGFAAGKLSGRWPKHQGGVGELTLEARRSPSFEGGNPLYRNVTCRQLRRGCLERCRNLTGEVRRVEPVTIPVKTSMVK